jgi:hypothetical protein
MYFTHHFAHRETLARFKTWLDRVGIEHREVKTQASGMPRIALTIEPGRADAIRMMINAVERSDPDGFPSFWEMASQPHHAPADPASVAAQEPSRPSSTAIGWHPHDPAPSVDPEFRSLCEALSSHWG